MTLTRHVYRVFIRATPESVWNALVDPSFTTRYFHGTEFDSAPAAGQPYRTVIRAAGDAPAVDGVIEVFDPPHRLVQTWHVLYDAAMAEEPPSRVEWTLTDAGEGLTRLDVVHGDLARSPLTWANVKDGWVWILDSLKSLLETGEPLPEATRHAPEPVTDAEAEWHRTLGIQANNSIWELLTKAERTAEEDEELVRRAYASVYHWARAARRGPENAARGEYMVARVWAAIGRGELALHHAQRCMTATQAAGLVDFDLAYAHEALARAHEVLGDHAVADAELEAAKAVPIADPEDLAILEADLAVPLR
jgi:uncharacterized protein YndB with AHSA1/START domain